MVLCKILLPLYCCNILPMLKKFNSLADLVATFPDEQTCIEYLEEYRWHGKVVSPFDPTSKVYKCKGNNYKCRNTGKYFNVKTDTLFHKSPIPLIKWFMAIWVLTTHRKGISSVQLGKEIGVTQKTAWRMGMLIRDCFKLDNDDTELSGVVEIDESFIGGKNKNRHKDKKFAKCKGRSFKDKVPVFGMLQRCGKVVAKVVANTQAKTLRREILKTVKAGSTIYSDEWNYGKLSPRYNHSCVYHCYGIYGIDEVTTNSIEGFWVILKRGIIGVYHRVSRKHLQRYVDEFTWRYNTRKLPLQGVFNQALQSAFCVTKRFEVCR